MSNKKDAIILLGGFILGKHPHFLESIQKRSLKILCIDSVSDIEKVKQMKSHPYTEFEEYTNLETINIDAIISILFEWEKKYDIKGVCNFKEPFSHAYIYISELFNLCYPGVKATLVSQNKRLQRELLYDFSPQYNTYTKEDIKNIETYPVVIKPVDLSGSIGVQKINNHEQLLEILDEEYFVDKKFLIEECIEGKEFSVEMLVQNNENVFFSITDKITNAGNNFVEIGHIVPSIKISEGLQRKIKILSEKIVKERLSFDNGMIHIEYKITTEGKVYLMEYASRPPGDGIMELYDIATDGYIADKIIDIVLGNYVEETHFKGYASQIYIEHESNKNLENVFLKTFGSKVNWLRETGVRSIDFQNELCEVLVEKEKGEKLKNIESSVDRAISFIFQFKDVESYFQKKESIESDISITYK
ncbi:ATP-grasp domain-containing protein [Staphylococcus saprophyticus]